MSNDTPAGLEEPQNPAPDAAEPPVAPAPEPAFARSVGEEAKRAVETMALEGHTGWVNTVAWSPDGARLASGSEDNTLKIWTAAGASRSLARASRRVTARVRRRARAHAQGAHG